MLLLLLILAPVAITAVVVVTNQLEWPTPFRDVAAVANVHPLTGAMSTLGLLLWAATAAVWLCAALLARACHAPFAKSYAAAAAITAYLALDDSYQLHERLVPELLAMHERVVLIAIAAVALGFGIAARALLLRTPLAYLACLALLPMSMALDNSGIGAALLFGTMRAALEDIGKWIGIVGWLMTALWHYRALARQCSNALLGPMASDPSLDATDPRV